jgi:hypothetical protein
VVSEIGELLLAVVEFAVMAAEIPIRKIRGEINVGDVYRAKRASIVTAVIRPLTNESTRFEMTVPANARLRVDLALPAPGHQPYLSFIDAFDRELIPRECRDRALLAGLWLEIPAHILKSRFARSRTTIRLTRTSAAKR